MKPIVQDWTFGLGKKGGKIEPKVMDILTKYTDIEAISMGSDSSLIIRFHGFKDREDMLEFCEFVFAKIRMSYHRLDKPPTIH